jgi:hypothetical protein
MQINIDHLKFDLIHGAYGVGCWLGDALMACVWARPIGNIMRLNDSPISIAVNTYLVEHLCVAKYMRGIGVTRLLLNYVVMSRPLADIRFIFLKEGKAVPTNFISWDNYLYARIPGKILNRIRERLSYPGQEKPIIIRKQQCKKISLGEAIEWCKTHMVNKNITINFPAYTVRTELWLWRSSALMAITDTSQSHPLDSQKIGLITGWYHLPGIDTRTAQVDIFEQQPYTWIWSPKSYTDDFSAEWIRDGIVWWQPYAWNMPTLMNELFLIC